MLSILSSLAMVVGGLSAIGLAGLAPANAAAAPTGSGVSYTLEGCRNNGDISLPNGSGKFICPDGAYTSGNLGKGWNELDLVPIRVTVKAGNSAPSTQNFAFALVVDNCSTGDGATGCATGRPGYDVLSVPVLNTSLSSGNCGSVVVGGQQYAAPGVGGTGTSLYRTLSITGQAKNSTCVYDAYARLALGSHLFPGASLHFNLTDTELNTGGVGARDVSIPVKEILPQSISKDMTASQGSSSTWSVSKSGPARVDTGDTCATDGGSGTATITVTWTKHAATPGNISITTTVYATNPASRPIDVSISDSVYGNQNHTGTALYTLSGSGTVLANTTQALITDTREVPANSSTDGYVSDAATATYTDNATGIPVPGTTTTSKSALISTGTTSQDTAVVTDDEWWSATDPAVAFSVAAPSVGSFTNYTAGDSVAGDSGTHVLWSSGTVSSSGSVTFTKTITGAQGANANATLSDVATVTPTGGTATNSNQLDIPVSVETTVSLNLRKTIPNDLTGTETATFDFTVKDSAVPANTVGTPSVSFAAGQFDKTVSAATGLAPGSYTVSETDAAHYAHQGDQTATVLGDTDAHCTGSVRFDNTHGPATAKATKVSNPTGNVSGWHFLLNGPGISAPGEDVVTDANGVATFTTALQQGTYTITEVAQTGWDQTGTSAGCTFTVDYPADADRTFDGCVITNTQRGALRVHKTVVANDSGSTLTDSFSICIQGPSYPSTPNCKSVGIGGGDVTWTDLLPGNYAVSEAAPGSPWIVSINHTSVTVNPGDTASTALSTVTNTRKGRARVIKTVSAHDGSNPAAPTGTDAFTFTLRTGATSIIGHPGTILETKVANAANSGQFDFATLLIPGDHYQVCEVLPDVGWTIDFGAASFVPEQFLADGVTLNPGVVNNVYCTDFVAQPGPDPTVFHVNNRRPPGGSALTIGYWKNWASCTKSATKQKNSLDQALYLFGANGLVVSATSGGYPVFGATYYLRLVAGNNPNAATDCSKAVNLLNKSTISGGKKMASDPAFNLAAQLVAAELNYKAGAATTVTAQINAAVLLLGKYAFDGNTHTTISAADAAAMNALATALDHYNNNI